MNGCVYMVQSINKTWTTDIPSLFLHRGTGHGMTKNSLIPSETPQPLKKPNDRRQARKVTSLSSAGLLSWQHRSSWSWGLRTNTAWGKGYLPQAGVSFLQHDLWEAKDYRRKLALIYNNSSKKEYICGHHICREMLENKNLGGTSEKLKQRSQIHVYFY